MIKGESGESYEEKNFGTVNEDAENLSAIKMCNRFFASSHKRSLLANAGVGTVDQAMSSVLHSRHHWVKLFALAHSVIIIDEVHAYDAYMRGILTRLLEWARSFGSHVILLSATLPNSLKEQFISSFNTETAAKKHSHPFPLVTKR